MSEAAQQFVNPQLGTQMKNLAEEKEMINNLKGHHFDFGRKGASSMNVTSPTSKQPQSALSSMPSHYQNRNALANLKKEQGSTHFYMGFDPAERPVTVTNSLSGTNLMSKNQTARMSTINAGANMIGGARPPVKPNLAGGPLGNQAGS